jgi:cell division protein ZapB
MMEAELKSLETKIEQFVQLCHKLRTDNHQLRQQLASALDQRRRLEEKIESATTRLEALLSHIPAEDET